MKDLGNASYVLGIQIYQDRSKDILGLSQKGYIKKILQRYGMQDCKPLDTPISKGDKLSLSQCPKNALEIQEIEKNFHMHKWSWALCILKFIRDQILLI